MNFRIYLDFYGVVAELTFSEEGLAQDIERDFSYFLSSKQSPTVKISVFNQVSPYEKIPEVKACLYLAGSISYDYRGIRYVDYNGEALTIYNYETEEGEIYSPDRDFLHELTYLLILSRVGELLDKKGVHRLHALGISVNGKGVMCLLPMGGGKSTLALSLLKDEKVKLISEDTPLISKEGKILPFPLRIGLDSGVKLDVPQQYLRRFVRRRYGSKTLIDIDYFKDKIAKISQPGIILIGEREFSNKARIVKTGKIKAIGPFIRNMVFGLGLPQMVEYFLRNNLGDILSNTKIALSRLFVSLKIIRESKTYSFIIGRNKTKNAETLLNFLQVYNNR